MNEYRDDLAAAQEQVRALRAENERLKAPKPKAKRAPFKWPAFLRRLLMLSPWFGLFVVLSMTIGAIGKCAANHDTVDYCYPRRTQCSNAGGIGCPDEYMLMIHRAWNPDDWVEVNHGAVVVTGKQNAINQLKQMGCPEVRP